MNIQRRITLAKATALLGEARELVEQAQTEEQDALDNQPESLHTAPRGERSSEVIEALGDAVMEIEQIIDDIGEAVR